VNDTIGNRDVIKNKENGLICGSLEDFVNAIKLSTMPENKKDISRYKQNAYKDILDNYNISTMSNAYIELYNSFLNSDIKGREK
jgi:glycosyltransferase involved in cell wall biosynthesis